ncbi:MAG: glycosyltransferase, partial [bacterium]|nr:glycosyltransferase [bacterium]
ITQKILSASRFKPLTGFTLSDKLKLVDWVSGAALIIRKKLFEEIGGWDEKYFLYFEDIDLCWRVKKQGLSIAVLDGVFVTHFGGRSLAQNWERKKQYYLSQEYFFRKNYGTMSALILKLIRWPYKILKT